MPLARHLCLLLAGAAFAVTAASAATGPNDSDGNATAAPAVSTVSTATESSSADGAALLADPGAASGAAAQEDHGHGYHSRNLTSHLTFEAGGGFNAPSSDSSPYITWGGNLTLGAGYRFDRRLSALIEYQFMDDKLPGALIAQTGSDGGNAHIWSLTIAPVVDLFPKSSNDIYVTGGGGFYRKVTNFTDIVEQTYCGYYYCEDGYGPAVVGHFSSNQGGWNVGIGFQHRLGSMYGDESKTKLFAEVRYLDVMTPAVENLSANGLPVTSVGADTKLFPVTLGIRF